MSVETREYKFVSGDEVDETRMGKHCETGEVLDFGPTLLIPAEQGNSRLSIGQIEDSTTE